jgi:murein L,D-transpeptidase YcbB/YkuD
VSILQKRLVASGDLTPGGEGDSELFDDTLEDAVRNFQQRHGLEADGIVGPRTLAAFNIPVEERLRQIQLNMERWRQFPDDLGERYILVNTANSELKVVENNKLVMAMRTVVGRPDRPTPVLSGQVTELVLNPYWYIPPRIARKDILPKIQKNPNFLSQQRIRVFEALGNQRRPVDPTKVNWSMVTANTLPYWFRQEPGPSNSLGRVKFLFPNKFKVYIHDTPARELFEKTQRNFSSGCVRIEQPVRLAEYVLQRDKDWTPNKIQAVLDSGARQFVTLAEPIPVYLLYWTAWVNDEGVIQFRRDVYGRDRALAKALRDEQAKESPTFGS